MSEKRFDLYVPVSDDARTTFGEVADILDHLATVYAWHPDVYCFLLTRGHEARQIDTVYELENGVLTMKMVDEHRRDNPAGCGITGCDVCASRSI